MTAPGDPSIEIVIAEDAVARMAVRLAAAGWHEALIVADANTQEAAGRYVASQLRSAGIEACEIVFAFAGAVSRRRLPLAPADPLGTHATRLRARYTTIDFLESIGALEDAIDEMLA